MLVEVRRYPSRPDAEILAWALRSRGVAAELRRVCERSSPNDESVVLVPRAGLPEARRVLSAERFQVAKEEPNEGEWPPMPPDSFPKVLHLISRRQRRARFWVLTFLPAGLLAASSGNHLFFSAIPIIWVPAILISSWKAVDTDCPRCGLPFGRGPSHALRTLGRLFSANCVTCGLAISACQQQAG
jgi:hypothetical protein